MFWNSVPLAETASVKDFINICELTRHILACKYV
jgi:hypothetical protein